MSSKLELSQKRETRNGELLTVPNLVTLLRLMLAPFVAADILEGYYRRAIALCFFAGLTDVIDGLLARKMGESTRTGAYLDPIADKILLSADLCCAGNRPGHPLVDGRGGLRAGYPDSCHGGIWAAVHVHPEIPAVGVG